MDLIRTLLSLIAALLGKQEVDEDLDEELCSHVEFAVEDNLKRGMSAEAARGQAAPRRPGGGWYQTQS